MSWLMDNLGLLLAMLLGLSEVLAMIPALKSNSILQMVPNIVKWAMKNLVKDKKLP